MYTQAIEWLNEAFKRYNEYYDLHQVNSIDILEELAISFLNNNQENQAEDIIGRILRIDSNNKIVANIKSKRSIITDLCHPTEQLLSLLTFTCSI